MGFLPPDTATWPSPLNGTSASVTEFKLMVAFMIPVGGHGGDQEPQLQLGPSVSGSSSWDSWTKLIIERLQPALGASPGGVAHLATERDDARLRTDRGERLAECQPGGHLSALLVAGQAHLAAGPALDRSALRPRPADHKVAFPAELGDGPLGHLRRERPAMPAFAVFDLGEPAPLPG